jgi:hypothetical protein
MRVADYKELRVYKLAFESAMQIFELSRKWPSEERYSLTVSDSDGEAAETEVHLDFAARCGYLSPEKQAELLDHYDHICAQLTNMINDAGSWCGTGCELREVPPDYCVGHEERQSVEHQSVEHDASNAPHASTLPRTDAPHAPTL